MNITALGNGGILTKLSDLVWGPKGYAPVGNGLSGASGAGPVTYQPVQTTPQIAARILVHL